MADQRRPTGRRLPSLASQMVRPVLHETPPPLEQGRAPVRRLKTLTHPPLLVVDKIGYLPVTQSGAVLFFQFINGRYGRASTILTSNKGFEEWGRILGDEVMAAALLDRLLHHCHIVNIRGNSYRMRRHAELSKAIHPLGNRMGAQSPASRESLP